MTERLKKISDYDLHVDSVVRTSDNEDHSFYGIMFDLEVKTEVPVQLLYVNSLFVRGDLGDITIFHAPKPHKDIYSEPNEWSKITSVSLPPSPLFPTEIKLPHPISLHPGSRTSFFVLSSNRSNGIVYDDERNPVTFENSLLKLHSGLATTSNIPFCALDERWWPWRPHREFVGKIGYSATFVLFRPLPHVAKKFSKEFLQSSMEFIACMKKRGTLPRDMVFAVLNMIRFDWFATDPKQMLNLSDTRRDDLGRIGWRSAETYDDVNGEYRHRNRNYQMVLREHKREYMKRKNLLDGDTDFDGY